MMTDINKHFLKDYIKMPSGHMKVLDMISDREKAKLVPNIVSTLLSKDHNNCCKSKKNGFLHVAMGDENQFLYPTTP